MKKRRMKTLQNVEDCLHKFEGLCDGLAEELSKDIDFDFHVTVVGGDGIVIGDKDGNVSSASAVISYIDECGKMSHEDFKSLIF